MTTRFLQQRFPQLTHFLDRAPMAGLMCAGAILLGVALATARTTNLPNVPASPAAESAVPATAEHPDTLPLLPEGTEIHEELGSFRTTGDRISFVPADQKHHFIGLENLILERVARTIADNSSPLEWIVSGTITECHGSNYLLVSRAVLKTRLRPEEDTP